MKKFLLPITFLLTLFIFSGCDQSVYEEVSAADATTAYSSISAPMSTVSQDAMGGEITGTGWTATTSGTNPITYTITFDKMAIPASTEYDTVSGTAIMVITMNAAGNAMLSMTSSANLTFTGSGPVVTVEIMSTLDSEYNVTLDKFLVNGHDMTAELADLF